MKKLLFIALLFAACRSNNHDGLYFRHNEGEYSIADDTIEVRDTEIIEHAGFQRIRNGKRLPKEFKTEVLFGLHPRFEQNYLVLKTDKYYKIN